MLPLAAGDEIDLASARVERAGIFASNAKQDYFGYVPEIEADAATVRAAVFADFVPDEVRLVLESPAFEDFEPRWQQRIGHPKIAMGGFGQVIGHGQRRDLFD